jgi:hypothetical protein
VRAVDGIKDSYGVAVVIPPDEARAYWTKGMNHQLFDPAWSDPDCVWARWPGFDAPFCTRAEYLRLVEDPEDPTAPPDE